MIPRAYVTAWRKKAPWTNDANVEQDLVLSRALVEIFSEEQVASSIAFRGGTALHKLFFDPAGRFSEDIDLVQTRAAPIGPAMNAIRDRLDTWLGPPGYKQTHGRVTLLYRFDSEFEPVGRRRLKIEINTREHFAVLGLTSRHFEVSNRWFEGAAQITVYQLDELLGTKLRALYQRKKGRDLFDLATALARTNADADRIVECFCNYMMQENATVTRAQFEANLADKAKDRAFIEDTDPILAPGVDWDFESALRQVLEKLVARMPGEPWKGKPAD